jgi:hypothetical protein
MRTLRAVVYVALVAYPALAQEEAPDPTPAATAAAEVQARAPKGGSVLHIQKTFILKHTGTGPMIKLLRAFPATLSESDVQGQHVISVSGAPAVVAAIEETIKRLDVPALPARSADVVAYLLGCSATPPQSDAASPDLRDVVAQLKKTFGYSGCAVVESLFTRASDGNTFHWLARSDKPATKTYAFEGTLEIEGSATPPVLRFNRLTFRNNQSGAGYNGSVEMRDGQRVVLGTIGALDDGSTGVVVLTAKVLP